MLVNGNLEVLGDTKVKIISLTDYEFDESDGGLLFLDSNNLFLNTGTEVLQVETTDRLNKLRTSLGSLIFSDFSFDPLAFNEDFHTISGLNANSTLLDALTQMDAAIPKTYTQSFTSAADTFLIEHNLDAEIAHVTVKEVYTNQKVKDDVVTVTYLDANSIKLDLTQSLAIKVLVSAI